MAEVIALGSTHYFLFTTRQYSTGAPFTLAGTPVLSVYEENNTTQITAGVSVSVDYDTVTGLNQATVVATSANGYENGKRYNIVITTGTVDSVSVVGEVVGEFVVESAAQGAIRTFNEAVFITDTVTTTTSNSTTAVNLTDFLDAQAPNNSTTGELWLWQDSTGELEYFRVQSMTSLLATVEAWPAGGALSAAVAANDKLWRVGYVDQNVVAISDDITAADRLEEFATAVLTGTASGTPTTTTTDSDLSGYADDELIGRTIVFTSGTAAGQAGRITDYANTSGVVTFTTLATAPAASDTFVIV